MTGQTSRIVQSQPTMASTKMLSEQHVKGKVACMREAKQHDRCIQHHMYSGKENERQTSKTVTKQHDSGSVATLQRQSSMPEAR